MNKQLLIDILTDQREVVLPPAFVVREAYNKIKKIGNTGQIVIITGMRRTGKSTLLQNIRKKKSKSDYYVNFDDDRFIQFSSEDFQMLFEVFIELYGTQDTFYFDEIQNIKGWERFVRRLHDKGKKIYITGSNATMLSKELGTHLTGRYIQIEIYPFSFREYIDYKNIKFLEAKTYTTEQKGNLKRLFKQYYKNGGIPEYLKTKNKEYLHSLYESILYKDIIVRYNLTQERPIKELVYYLSSNISQEISYNKLKNLIGIKNASTISEYCSYLENSFLSFLISRYDYSLKKQMQYAKKQYFIDNALAESVGFKFSEDKGRALENIVFIELKRRNKDIYFHKDKQECDFIIRNGKNIISAIQVAAFLDREETRQREIKGLIEAMRKYSLKEGYIITEDTEEEGTITEANKKYKIHIKPIWKWLLEK